MDLNRSIQDTIENFDINVINFDLNEAVEDEEQAIIEVEDDNEVHDENQFLMKPQDGGENAIGHTVKDHVNYCYKLKIKAIEGGDSQVVCDKLQEAYSEDPNFFFRVRLDSDGRVCNLFWRDSMMLEDYKIYGDVTVFDTTYRTNRYNLICAPFVGINNHWKNTMFACSFIGDETTDSFVWLFETFKKAMGGKCPVSLFTDQDAAMQQQYQRFGVLKSDDTFKAAFMKCLSGCINEAQFEVCWDSMMTKYKLKNNSWFKRLYSLKHKWSTALSKDFFSAGILSSQRSESTNHAVGFKANKKTSLTEFYNIFQKTVKTWRRNEYFYEFNSIKSIPTSSYPMSALLKHAAEVYTHTLFRDFEEEFNLAIGSQTKLLFINGDKMVYQVYLEGRDGTTQAVTYDPVNQTIQCPCKNFEESGWLCFHSLRILHMHSVEKIPEQYISIRWTKVAKDKVWESIEAEQRKKGTLNNFTPWRLHMVRKYYSLILKSHKFEKARKVLEERYAKDSSAIDEIISAMKSTDNHSENTTGVEKNSETTSSNVVQVLDPARAKTKGGQSNKRIPGSYDYMKKGKRRKHREFGAKTPNINNKYML
ncbi:protein FAR1-RELATED SEQUENCE 5-like [Chenopodium quinoa]|uniref:protein FAR1-RELATED SEQUENCE 5-like n=1 Tax=Chenopodium quinoa TaxID=63459 RepID=UPI000B77935B|nr:protein FAR1-RELATED SEQUENCE 5-like [Chenopodium quinoa]